jgi:hypothetical protein
MDYLVVVETAMGKPLLKVLGKRRTLTNTNSNHAYLVKKLGC